MVLLSFCSAIFLCGYYLISLVYNCHIKIKTIAKFKNEIIFFGDGENALTYLTIREIEPFIIISDINMPKLNGLELRQKIHQNERLRIKCIPYLFFTTGAQQKQVIDAYSTSVQGFFIKPDSLEKLKST